MCMMECSDGQELRMTATEDRLALGGSAKSGCPFLPYQRSLGSPAAAALHPQVGEGASKVELRGAIPTGRIQWSSPDPTEALASVLSSQPDCPYLPNSLQWSYRCGETICPSDIPNTSQAPERQRLNPCHFSLEIGGCKLPYWPQSLSRPELADSGISKARLGKGILIDAMRSIYEWSSIPYIKSTHSRSYRDLNNTWSSRLNQLSHQKRLAMLKEEAHDNVEPSSGATLIWSSWISCQTAISTRCSLMTFTMRSLMCMICESQIRVSR